MPDLTVISINKNSEKYIKQSCLSILSQDYKNFKLSITDSASTDKSIEIIKKMNSNKIEIYNVGAEVDHHDAFLYGIEKAKTKYITFMTTTDGYVDTQWFSSAISELEKDENLSFVYANSIRRNKENYLDKINQPFFLNVNLPSHEEFLPFYLGTQYHINELNCIWSTNVVQHLISKIDRKNDHIAFDIFENLEFLSVKLGFLGKYINTIANYGREHEDSLTSKHNEGKKNIKNRTWLHKQRKKQILKNLRNMSFLNRNFEIISKVENVNFLSFYLAYFFYMVFFPQFKIAKPLYSLNYITVKIFNIIFYKFLIKIVNKFLLILQKIKFYKRNN